MKEISPQSASAYGFRFKTKLETGHYLPSSSRTLGEFDRVKCIFEINAQLSRMKQEEMYVCIAKNSIYSGLLFKAIHHRIKTEDPFSRQPIILKPHELDMYKRNGRTGETGEVMRLNIHSPTGPIYPIDEGGYPFYVGLTNDDLRTLFFALGSLREIQT